MINPLTMALTSDMSYWMLVLAGLIPSRGDINERVQQALEGRYQYNGLDLRILQQLNPIPQLEEVSVNQFDSYVDSRTNLLYSRRTRFTSH